MFNQKPGPWRQEWPVHVEIRPGFAKPGAKRAVSLNNYQNMMQLNQSRINKSSRPPIPITPWDQHTCSRPPPTHPAPLLK